MKLTQVNVEFIIEQQIDKIINDYLAAALWAEIDSYGEPLDEKYSIYDFTKKSIELTRQDLKRFIEIVGYETIDKVLELEDSSLSVGHDIWLTRSESGAGFLDGQWPRDLANKLYKACDKLGMAYVVECGNNRHITIEG